MFGPPGHLYVYFTYGMHFCCNVVTGPGGHAPARSCSGPARSSTASTLARARRPGATDRDLARGPARLCRALGIDRQHDGADLRAGPGRARAGGAGRRRLHRPRVGLRGAPDRPWRFWMTGEPTVSAYRPAKPR